MSCADTARRAAAVRAAIDSADKLDDRKAQDRAREYTASDGSLWHLRFSPPPIPTRAHDWMAVHDDYDGAPDAGDDRYFTSATIEGVIVEIEDWIDERACAVPAEPAPCLPGELEVHTADPDTAYVRVRATGERVGGFFCASGYVYSELADQGSHLWGVIRRWQEREE